MDNFDLRKYLSNNILLKEGIITLTPSEEDQVQDILKTAKSIFKSGDIPSKDYYPIGEIDFTSADNTPGQLGIYIDYKSQGSSLGSHDKGDSKDLTDNKVMINAYHFLPAYSGFLENIFSKATGENPDRYLEDTIRHELIHAKDPAVNQQPLNAPYDSSVPELYYGSWVEFPAQTGEFFEAIKSNIKEALSKYKGDKKEIKKLEQILQNILDFYSGKTQSFSSLTQDFLAGGKKGNVLIDFIRQIADFGGNALGIATHSNWESMNSLIRYYSQINLIKQHNPEGYKEFQKDLYKIIKKQEEFINYYIKERDKKLKQPPTKPIYVGGKGGLIENHIFITK